MFFNSGGILPDSENLLPQLKSQCQMLVLDTYHSFMARPFSLKNLQEDIYVLGGGYKYLQAGEGVCFLYTPPKAEELRPKYTGWYAHFESLDTKPSAQCGYAIKAWRFWGSTFDPSSMYRLQSVFDFLDQHDLTTEVIHDHSVNLQEQCIKKITQLDSKSNWVDLLKKSSSQLLAAASRGNFLSFPLPSGIALEIQGHLKKLKILTDSRESSSQSFLRLGFGLYHDEEDLEILAYRAASNTLYSE
jgi:kynureninase